MRLVGPMLLALAAAAACGRSDAPATAAPTPPLEALGYFNCYGHSSAMFAGAFSIRSGGTANFNGQEGTWAYDAATRDFIFSQALTVATARLDTETGELDARLRPGQPVPHAEDERMTCRPAEPGKR